MEATSTQLTGIIRCTRYSFMPNRLHLCGPENQADILEFYSRANENEKPKSITPILQQFETLYPYLKLIAAANQEKNPFGEKIVEAYWLGNEKLEKVPAAKLFSHIIDTLKLKRKVSQKEYKKFSSKFNKSALPHHNFHVFSVWRRTGHTKTPQTLATMDACRISWGQVTKIKNQSLIVKTKPLTADKNGKIMESDFFVEREILNYFERNILLKNIRIGDCISLHWGCACEKIDTKQVANLQKYTDLSLLYATNL
jgi:hypothetical protein